MFHSVTTIMTFRQHGKAAKNSLDTPDENQIAGTLEYHTRMNTELISAATV